MDLAERTLTKPKSEIDVSRLGSLLELALRNSVFAGDPFAECVGVTLLEDDLETNQLKILGSQRQSHWQQDDGIRALAFTFTVEWPMSLVITSMAIKKYQMIFRHLLNIKYCILLLSRFWHVIVKTSLKRKSESFTKCHALSMVVLNAMLHFLRNFEYFIQVDVIEPNWHVLMNQLTKVQSLDDLISHHNDFLDRILKDSMLTHATLVEGFSAVINLCYSYHQDAVRLFDSEAWDELYQVMIDYRERSTVVVASFISLLCGKSGDYFEHNMLMLVERLDFNYFYSEHSATVQTSVSISSPHS